MLMGTGNWKAALSKQERGALLLPLGLCGLFGAPYWQRVAQQVGEAELALGELVGIGSPDVRFTKPRRGEWI